MEWKCVLRITSKQGKQMRNHRCQHVEQSLDKTDVQFLYPLLYVLKFDKSYSIEYHSNTLFISPRPMSNFDYFQGVGDESKHDPA